VETDHGDDGDDAFLAEDLAIGQFRVGHLTLGEPVHEDVATLELADHPCSPIRGEVDDRAVLDREHAIGGDTGGDGQVCVGDQVPDLAVDGQHIARSEQVVAVEQFARAGVSGHMHHRRPLVHDGDAVAREAVDHPEHRVLVARDQRGRQQHYIARAGGDDRMLVVGDPRERAEGLALGAGGDDQHLVVGVVLDLLEVDQRVLGHLQVAEFAGHGHVAQHRTANVDDLSVVPHGRVHHLLDTVNVGGEAGDDQLLLRVGEHPLQRGFDVALVGGEAGGLGVGRVGHEQVDPLLTEAGEAAQVGEAVIQGKLVHLEVAGVQHGAGFGPNRNGQRVRDRMVDGEELQIELADLHPVALRHDPQVDVAQPVFAELLAHKGEREPGAEDGQVAATAQQVRNSSDVVLVTVGQHQGLRLVQAVLHEVEAGQDQVDAGVFLGREQDAAVDEHQFAVDLEGAHVPADVAVTAQGRHAQGVGAQPGRCSQGFSHESNLDDEPALTRQRRHGEESRGAVRNELRRADDEPAPKRQRRHGEESRGAARNELRGTDDEPAPKRQRRHGEESRGAVRNELRRADDEKVRPPRGRSGSGG